MAAHSSVLAWKIPWTEAPGGFQPMGSGELDMTECAHMNTHMRVRTHRPRCIWDRPRPGIEFMSPALAGTFFTTEPPGKLWS